MTHRPWPATRMSTSRAARGMKATGLEAGGLRSLLLTIGEALAPAAAYLVGGAVRDLRRGLAPNDLDLVVAGDASDQTAAIGRGLDGHVFALDEARGQYRIALTDGRPVRYIDVAPLVGDIEADLRERDFTIDAMAAPLIPGAGLGPLIDPLGGARDLEARIVRMTDAARFAADPLRLLRAVRLASELDFEIEAATAAAIEREAGQLEGIAAERQRDELCRMLATPRAATAMRTVDRLGLLARLIPELTAAHGVEQPIVHFWDVFDHSIETVAALDALIGADEPQEDAVRALRRAFRDGLAGFEIDAYIGEPIGGQRRGVLLKLAGLLHDVAKPETKMVAADGRVHFYGHPERGAETAARICRRLRLGRKETSFVALLVEEHLRPTQLSNGDLPSRRALYRFFRDLGEAAPACLILSLADGAAAAGPRLRLDRWQGHVAYVAYVLTRSRVEGGVATPARRLLTGDELMGALDLEPGPRIGRLLAAIEEAAGGGEIGTQDEALELATALAAAWRVDAATGAA